MKRSLIALALAATFSLSAQAAELSYSYLEADYAHVDIDDADDINLNGFGVRGSVAFGESFYGFGAYQRGEDDVDVGLSDDVQIDADRSQAGFGWRHGLTDNTDFNGELSWLNQTIDAGPLGGHASANAYRVSGGVRSVLGENFEGYAKANYTDGDDFDGDFSGTLGGQFKFSKMWGVTGEAEFGSDERIYTVGVRASF
jgi:hypothetical protein